MQSNFNDINNMRYIGWEHTSDQDLTNFLFSQNNINSISKKVTELLEGVDPDGKTIIVTDKVITGVLSNILANDSYATQVGDIYSRYTIPRKNTECVATTIINKTIETIVSSIKTETQMEQYNESLSIWNSVLGEQNELGLMPTPKIKLREKHPHFMAFNMNY